MARRKKTRMRSESADTVNTNDDSMPGPSQPVGRAHKKKRTDKTTPPTEPAPTMDVAVDDGGGLQQTSDVMSGMIDAVPGAGEQTDVVAGLVKKVIEQQATINRLTQQVDFLLSYLGINVNNEPNVKPLTTSVSVSDPAGDGNLPSTSQALQPAADTDEPVVVPRPTTFADISARRPAPLSAAMKQAVVSAVYRDFEDRDRRNRNVVISGIPSTVTNDAVAVKHLLEEEYGRTYEVVKCRRLGRPTPGKTQPVLVTLTTAAEAQYLVNNARLLRQSSDSHVRATVFINPDITRAEAFAAYQERCERRVRAASRPPRDRRPSAAGQLAGRLQQTNSQTVPPSSPSPLPPVQPPSSSSSAMSPAHTVVTDRQSSD